MNNGNYTYGDYLKESGNEYFEIIDGFIYKPETPYTIHQHLLMDLSCDISSYINSTKSNFEIYVRPLDVVLISDIEDISSSKNVIQPDIIIVSDKNKLVDEGCIGSPDMIIEIVSQHNPSHDYVRKLYLYEKYGVKEYWIVDPSTFNILVYILGDNGYNAPSIYNFNDKVKVNIFDDLEIDFKSFNLE